MEDQHPSPNNTRETECIRIPITEDEGEDHHQYFDGRRIHRLPQVMRFNKHNEEDYYAPKVVSFGPYYHGLPELGMAEEFKHEFLTSFVSISGKDSDFFYYWIFEVIDQIRNCYVGVSRDAYDDMSLAVMMLLDASFAIYLMVIVLGDEEKYSHFSRHLRIAELLFAVKDMYLLENQIPLWVINLVIKLIYGEGSMLICKFSSLTVFANSRQTRRIPREDQKQPLHLLDAFHRLLVEELDNAGKEFVEDRNNAGKELVEVVDNAVKFKELVKDFDSAGNKPVNKCQWWPGRKENPNEFGKFNRQSRSVTDLKEKGINFKPSTFCLKNIKFKSYKFYGQLQLPGFSPTIPSNSLHK